MPNLQILSDVHGRWDKTTISPEAKIILALGDLSEGSEAIDWLAKTGRPVIYVPGNHEYYGHDIGTCLDMMRIKTSKTQVTIADKLTITAGSTRFICATLWTDHNSLDYDLMARSFQSMNDYRNIKVTSWLANADNKTQYSELLSDFESQAPQHRGLFPTKPEYMNPLVGLALHRSALDYLTQELAKPWTGKTVVLSHHAPSLTSLQFAGYFTTSHVRKFPSVLARKFNPHKIGSYASSLDYLFSNHEIALWAHGHLHESIRYTINGTDIISNPTGYPYDQQNKRFRPCLLVKPIDPIRHRKLLCLTLYQSLLIQTEYGSLVKNHIMRNKNTPNSIFETIDDFICFAQLYNQCIAPLLQQTAKDRSRAEHILEPLNIHNILARRLKATHTTSEPRLQRFLHEMLDKISANSQRSKDWIAAAQSIPELANWTIEGDI